VPYPEDNARSAARENLGRTLFFDPRLSGSGVISCGTCHNPGLSWSDGLDRGVGHGMKRLARRTPTILNVAWAEALFWDGRAASLEEQALGPISSPDEMNMPLEALIPKLQAVPGYAPLFEAAYPGEGISAQTVAKALASFQRTVVSARAPFDRWLAGEERAIPDSAKRGFALFDGKARCSNCHSGWRSPTTASTTSACRARTSGAGRWWRASPCSSSPSRPRRSATSSAALPTCTTARRRPSPT
jgi:cytochrome c peroxidase